MSGQRKRSASVGASPRPKPQNKRKRTPGTRVADVVLSMRDERYKQILYREFHSLGMTRDPPREEKVAMKLFTKFKRDGARFFYLDRQNSLVRLKEEEALKRMTREIKRRIETSKLWRDVVPISNQEELTLSQLQAVAAKQKAKGQSPPPRARGPGSRGPYKKKNKKKDKPKVRVQTWSAFNMFQTESRGKGFDYGEKWKTMSVEERLPYQDLADAANLKVMGRVGQRPQWEIQAKRRKVEKVIQPKKREGPPKWAIKAATPAIDTSKSRHERYQRRFEVQGEEKKQDDNDMTHPGDVSLQTAQDGEAARPQYDHIRTIDEVKRQSPSVFLSLRDVNYQQGMWIFFRKAGRTKDHDREDQLAGEALSFFKEKMGSDGKFFRVVESEVFEVSDETARGKMLADIKRRMKNWNLWSRSPEEPGGGHPRWPRRLGTADPTSQPPRENSAPASQPPPRRSTRELTPRNEPTNELEPRDGDIILSLRDGLYKDVMYKHYKILGKRDPGDKGREAEMGSQIFRSLRSTLGNKGRFFKRMSRGDYPYLIDDDGALEKIVRDLTRRNESLQKWRNTDSSNQLEVPPNGEDTMGHPPIPLDFAWRDQVVPSPIEVMADTHLPEPTNRVHRHPVESLPSPNSHPRPKSKAKPTIELLMSSHLGQRLPPLKQMTAIKSVHTPNQLVQMLQYTTHKLNELNGTHIKHCKVLRLYNLSELSVDPESVTNNAPTLSQLAEYMETTPKSLKKWYNMYLHAVMRDFNFLEFGNDKIKDHHGVFFDPFYAVEEECYQFSEGSERAMEEYCQEVAMRVVVDAENGEERAMSRTGGNNLSQSQIYEEAFLRNFQKNEARILELGSGLQVSSTAKRVKKGHKERILCMVVGCEKHAQTKCDGCCTIHFRLLSSAAIKDQKSFQPMKKPPHIPANASRAMQLPSKSSSTVGERISEADVPDQMPLSLGTLDASSRVYVEWEGDHRLYKATVKKIYFDRAVPMIRIHYDGKKRHILDTIPLRMVKSFIRGENPGIHQNEAARHEPVSQPSQSLGNDPNASATSRSKEQEDHGASPTKFPDLAKIYPGTLPEGKAETKVTCPELGSGWHVHVVLRKGGRDNRADRYFTSPTDQKFRSVKEVQRYWEKNPDEFDAIPSARRSKPPPPFENERLDEECDEISRVNQLSYSTAQAPAYSQDSIQRDQKLIAMRSIITISPITTEQYGDNGQLPSINHPDGVGAMGALANALPPSLHCLKPPGGETTAVRNGIMSPKGVVNGYLPTTENGTHFKSTFTSPSRSVQPPLHHQLYQSPSMKHFPGMRSASATKLQRNRHTTALSGGAEIGSRRPKRKLKPITRFEEQGGLSSHLAPQSGMQSKSALCHCPDCNKGDLSVQGIYAHYGRAHNGKVLWQNVTFSCPFCPSARSSRIFQSFNEIDMHVYASHPGCIIQGPHPSKLSGQSNNRVQNNMSISRQNGTPKQNDRVLRERKATPRANDYLWEEEPLVEAEEPKGPPTWTEIEYVQLLPDGRKEYPRDISRVIEMIDEHCQKQEEVVGVAREQRIKLCKNEVDQEIKALDEERLSYQRGLRERSRMADKERIEKHKFAERLEQQTMLYQYENRNRRRNQEDVEVDKLCSRPIRFSKETSRQSSREGNACTDEQCQFCQKDKGYLHHLLLDSEISEFEMDAPATESPVFQQSTKLLNPSFRIIDNSYFSDDEGADDGGKDDDANEASIGSKRVNKSRRDASTAKRLKAEEERLWMLQNTKHSLGFIKKYNKGMILNAWGDKRIDNRGRRG